MREPDVPPVPRRLYAPLVPAAIGLAIGIVVDRFESPFSTSLWLGIAIFCSLVGVIRPRLVIMMLGFMALGGARHHLAWSDVAKDDISLGSWTEPTPAWIRGTIVDGPSFQPGEMSDDGSTRLILDVNAIQAMGEWKRVSGRVLAYVGGDRSDLVCGMPVEVAGNLSEIAGPKNPGESDRRERWLAEGIRLRMNVDDADGVWPDPEGVISWRYRVLGWARARSQKILVSGLDRDVSALAAALLLGRREGVDPDLNDAFARTGTTHLLAISGLHLQALGWVLFGLFLRIGVKRKFALACLMFASLAYGLLVGFTPSVTRSVAMTIIVSSAGVCDRCASIGTRLAFAAICTMLLNPTSLFDAGCQLSFLAVMVLVWGVPGLFPYRPPKAPDEYDSPKARIDALEKILEPLWKKWIRWGIRLVVEAFVTSFVIWLAALPVVALRFHMISPIGILLNLPLIPITTIALLFAGTTLGFSWIPGVGDFSAWMCQLMLRWTMTLVRWGANIPGGWTFTPGPSVNATLFFYGLFALASWASFRRWPIRKGLWIALAVDSLILVIGLWIPGRPGSVEAEILAVDHGLAVVIQATDGKAILYDCGKMRDPRVGRRIIAPALWSRGVSRIESVIISHADSDHYNGLPDILERFSIGELRIPPGFGGRENPEAERLLEKVRSMRIPVRELMAGDDFQLSAGKIEVVHPPRDWNIRASDNAHSIVANVFGPDGEDGLLLTGDLEGIGLFTLAERPRPIFETMLSPHHGGRTANPPWFYKWAKPKRVIASQRKPPGTSRDSLAPLESQGVRVDRTWKEGAILMQIGPRFGLPIRSIRSAILTILGIVIGLVLFVFLAVMEWGAWTLVMPGRRIVGSEIEPPPWEPIDVVAKDGARLHGARHRAESPLGTLVFLHGFGEDRSAMRTRAEAFHLKGWTVAVLDTRGRGHSEGDRTAFGGREADDLHKWLDVLSETTGPIVAWGRSMGAAISARAAVEDSRISAVILEAPYADLKDAVGAWIARMRLPRFFAKPILWRAERLAGVSLHEPRPIDVAPQVAVPVLILHGSLDPVVAVRDVKRLADAFPKSVEVIEIDGARHGDVFDLGGELLVEKVALWTSRIGISSSPSKS